ncbi:hypothetical protein GW755_02420 [bacterium]|nr:hypothetical protein [bacterium]
MDLVTLKKSTIYIVEVKTRTNRKLNAMGGGERILYFKRKHPEE